MIKYRIATLVAGALLTAGTVSAGAWTQPKGGSYQRLSLNYYLSTEDYTPGGNHFELNFGGKFSDTNITWYQEWGATDAVTFLWSLPIKRLVNEGDFHHEVRRGVGDIEFGARFRLFQRGVIVSLQTTAFIPWAYKTDDFMSIGGGEEQLDARLMAGLPLPRLRSYVGLEVAYRARAGEPSDQLRYLAEVGTKLTSRISARAKLEVIRGRDNGSFDTLLFNTRSGDWFDLDTVEMTGSFWMTRELAFEAGWAVNIGGKSTSKGQTFSLAVVWRKGQD